MHPYPELQSKAHNVSWWHVLFIWHWVKHIPERAYHVPIHVVGPYILSKRDDLKARVVISWLHAALSIYIEEMPDDIVLLDMHTCVSLDCT